MVFNWTAFHMCHVSLKQIFWAESESWAKAVKWLCVASLQLGKRLCWNNSCMPIMLQVNTYISFDNITNWPALDALYIHCWFQQCVTDCFGFFFIYCYIFKLFSLISIPSCWFTNIFKLKITTGIVKVKYYLKSEVLQLDFFPLSVWHLF